MKKSAGFLFIYYLNNYLLSYNVFIALFLFFQLYAATIHAPAGTSTNTTGFSDLLILLSFASCGLCIVGLYRSFVLLDAIRRNKASITAIRASFRSPGIMVSIAGAMGCFAASSAKQSLWYSLVLVCIGQFYLWLSEKGKPSVLSSH